MNKTHVVISSSTGPLVAGLVDYASLQALQDDLNSGPDLRCLAVTDPATGRSRSSRSPAVPWRLPSASLLARSRVL